MTLVYSVPSGATSWNDFPMFPGATINLVSHGDSITCPGAVLRTWLHRVAALITSNVTGTPAWTNNGISGASWNLADSLGSTSYPYTMLQDAPLRVDPKKSGSLTNWLIVFAGTNGINNAGNTAAQEYSYFQTYIAARISAGWSAANIIVCTMLPRTAGIFGDQETNRTTYNASLVSGATTYGYKLARLDLDANIGAAGQNLNATYFQDGVHPTDAGQVIIADIIYAVMFP